MRYLLRLAAALFLLLLLVAPALAQGELIITDPGRRLDRQEVTDAANKLRQRGAAVAIYLVQSGGQDDFNRRLVQDDLARSDGSIGTDVIAIYAALDQQFSSIRYGDDWYDALGVNDNYDVIRQGDFNPGLANGEYTSAFTDALTAIDEAIASPPTPGGGTTINVNPGEAFNNFVLPSAGVAAVGAGAVVGGVVLSRRRRAAKTRATAELKLKEARENVATLITDLGRRFKDASDKAQYDKVSYAPADVARLSSAQQAAQQDFIKVQTSFDDAGEQLQRYATPTLEQINQVTTTYGQIESQARALSDQLATVEQMRAELDRLAQQAPGEIDRAKKA